MNQTGTPLANANHERFAQLIVAGESGRAAWLAVSPASKPASADVSASRLLRNAKVAARIEELRAHALVRVQARADSAVGSAQWIVERAVEVVERALNAVPVTRMEHGQRVEVPGEWTCNLSAAVPALALLAKRHREFSDKQEHSGPDGGPIPLLAAVAHLSDRQLRELLNPGQEGAPNG